MKKYVFMLLLIIFFPYIFCLIGSLFSETIRIGQGGNSIERNRLGKDVLIEINGLYKTMDVEEYILGVLPGTISVDYDMEALKVQAVLIRTNILKEMEEKGSSDAADLSYQYLTVEERKALFGERNFDKYNNKFEQAVVETAGKVLRQEGSLIMAMYHEVSIGKTASAAEILGEEIAYLQSVESSQDVEAKHYMNVVSYTWAELQELDAKGLNATGENLSGEPEQDNKENPSEGPEESNKESLPGEQKSDNKVETSDKRETDSKTGEQVKQQDIQVTEATENGFVIKLSVDGTIYTGEEAVEKYRLSSSNFYVENIEDGIRFVCLGKGNCLGVSQYGANRMALEGKTAEEIIHHYYGKVTLEKYR